MEGRVKPQYPPNVRLANIVFSGSDARAAADLAVAAADWLRELLEKQQIEAVTLIGPAPAPIERIKNRWRWHVLLKSANAGELTRVIAVLMERFLVPANLRVQLDRISSVAGRSAVDTTTENPINRRPFFVLTDTTTPQWSAVPLKSVVLGVSWLGVTCKLQ
jgi:hypothetical protein